MTAKTHHTMTFDCACAAFHTSKTTGQAPSLLRLAWKVEGQEPQCYVIHLEPGVVVEPATIAYHGVDPTWLEGDGRKKTVPLPFALTEFVEDAGKCDRFIAFNMDFHHRQLDRALKKAGIEWSALGPLHCVMTAAAPACNIPLMRPGGGLKSPKLLEACAHFGIPAPVLLDDPIGYGKRIVMAVEEVDLSISGDQVDREILGE